MEVDYILSERQKTHGDFYLVSMVAQRVKASLGLGWSENDEGISETSKEALELIATKMARIVCGDTEHLDSWRDIQGYCELAIREIERDG